MLISFHRVSSLFFCYISMFTRRWKSVLDSWLLTAEHQFIRMFVLSYWIFNHISINTPLKVLHTFGIRALSILNKLDRNINALFDQRILELIFTLRVFAPKLLLTLRHYNSRTLVHFIKREKALIYIFNLIFYL